MARKPWRQIRALRTLERTHAVRRWHAGFRADGRPSHDQWVQVLLDAAPVGISIGTPDGDIVIYNSAWERISGYTAEEARRVGWFELAYPDPEERAHAVETAVRALKGGAPYVELEITRKDGRRIWAQFVTAPVVVGGKPYNFTFMTDVTDRKLAELRLASHKEELERAVNARTAELEGLNETLRMVIEELRAADLAKSRFIRTMSHELRTPLNSVIGFSDVMLRGLTGDLNGEQRRQLEMIRDAGKHLLSIVQDVLEIAGLEAGTISLRMADTDAVEVAREAAEMLRPSAAGKGLCLRLGAPRGAISLRTDVGKLRQALLNVAANAVKFTERGTDTIAVSEDPDSVRFTVADTGPGIDEEIRDRMFEEFVQGTLPDGSRPDGTGLGLAISRGLVRILGGSLRLVESSSMGSVFELVLPKSAPRSS